MSKYVLNGKEVYSDKGKLVATLDADGNPVMAPGMAGPHSRGVREFLSAGAEDAATLTRAEERMETDAAGAEEDAATLARAEERAETEETDGNGSAYAEGETKVYVGRIPAAKAEGGEPPSQGLRSETLEEYCVSTIPESELPPFSKEYGVNTEGFQEFVKKYKLTGAQVAALIRRLLK